MHPLSARLCRLLAWICALMVCAAVVPGMALAQDPPPPAVEQVGPDGEPDGSPSTGFATIEQIASDYGLNGTQGVVRLDIGVNESIQAGTNLVYTMAYTNTGALASNIVVEVLWTKFSVNKDGNDQFCLTSSPANPTVDACAPSGVQGPAVTKTACTATGCKYALASLSAGQSGRFSVTLGSNKSIYPKTNVAPNRPAGSAILYVNTSQRTSDDTANSLVIGPVFVLTKAAATANQKIYPLETGEFVIKLGNATGTGDSSNGQIRADARPATNVVVQDTFPAGSDFVSSSQPTGVAAPAIDTVKKTVTWTIPGPLNPGASLELRATFKKLDVNTDCGNLSNSVYSVTSDQMPMKDATLRYVVTGSGAKIAVVTPIVIQSVAAEPGSVTYGSQGKLRIKVQSFWNQPIAGVRLDYTVQSNATYVANTASPSTGVTVSASTVSWTFDMPAASKDTPTVKEFTLDVLGGYSGVVTSGTGRAAVFAPAGVPSACLKTKDGRLGLTPRLKVTKSTEADPETILDDGNYQVERGQEFEYLLVVENTGVADATSVTLVDSLPKEVGANFAYVGGSANIGGASREPDSVVNGLGGALTWNNLTVPSGEQIELRYRLRVDGRDFVKYCNSILGRVATNQDEAISYGKRSVCVKIHPDIVVTKTADRTTVDPSLATDNRQVRFTLTLKNNEPVAYTAGLVDVLDQFIFVRGDGGTAGTPTYDATQKIVQWPLISLAPGQEVTAYLIAEVPNVCTTRDYVNEGRFNIPDLQIKLSPAPTAKVRVNCGTVEYTKSVDRNIVSLGDKHTYSLNIKNGDGKPASNVPVEDLLPVGFTFEGMAATSNLSTAPTITARSDGRTLLKWTIPSIDATKTVVIKYVARSGSIVGKHENWVTVTAGGVCKAGGDCRTDTDGVIYASRSVEVQPLITMEPQISPNACALPGDTRTYKLSIVNTNNHDYTGMTVAVTLPLGLEYARPLGSTAVPGTSLAADGSTVMTWNDLRIGAKPSTGASQLDLLVELKVGQVWGNIDTQVQTTSPDGLVPRKDDVQATVLVCPPSPAIAKTVDRRVVRSGQELIYQIAVANTTPSILATTVEDVLPEGFTFVSQIKGAAPTQDGGKLTWQVEVPGALNDTAGVVFLVFKVRAGDGAPGVVATNTATAQASGTQFNADYNAISVTYARSLFLPVIRR